MAIELIIFRRYCRSDANVVYLMIPGEDPDELVFMLDHKNTIVQH